MLIATTVPESAERTFDTTPEPEPVDTFVDRHCPECGYLEPHHHQNCFWKE